MKIFINLLAISIFGLANLCAGELRNEDSKRYELKVHEGSTVRNTWIDANSTTLNLCSSCEIEVVGVGTIKISGSERVVIKNGRLSKQ